MCVSGVSVDVCQWMCASGCVSVDACQWMCASGCVPVDSVLVDVCQWSGCVLVDV